MAQPDKYLLGSLLRLARRRPILGAHLDPAATMQAVEAQIAAGLSDEEARALMTASREIPDFTPEQLPITEHSARHLRSLAETTAIYGLGYSREETIDRIEDLLASACKESDYRAILVSLRDRPPHPTAQTSIPLEAIEGIGAIAFSEGHYAVFIPADLTLGLRGRSAAWASDPVLRFYRIYTPTTGHYQAGPVIRRYASDNELAITPDEARAAVTSIAADPDGAAFRYSDTYANCWVCGRTLTDAVSRLLSVGPVCRGFAHHEGLRHAGNEVDQNPERRAVYRALRNWALDQGFVDPRTREDRAQKSVTASCVASAWSGIPGVLALGPTAAVEAVNGALRGKTSDEVIKSLHGAPPDTCVILIESGVLSVDVLNALNEHPHRRVRDAVGEFFVTSMGI